MQNGKVLNIGNSGPLKVQNITENTVGFVLDIFANQLYKIPYKKIIARDERELVKKFTFDFFEHCKDRLKDL